MDKQKEIESMALKMRGSSYCNIITCTKCGWGEGKSCCKEFEIASKLFKAGYGNVKQAVKEFAERVKSELEKYRLENEEQTDDGTWQFNSSQFSVNVDCEGGLIDKLVENFAEGKK